jgi:general secretion pathway protein L
MATRFLVHIGNDFPEISWVSEGAAGAWSEPAHGSLNQLAALTGERPVDVLVPAEQVFLTEVQIASRNRRKLLQALPYSVEDQLAGDVDEYHFALGQSLGNDRYLVAAVARSTMDRWMAAFVEAGLEPRCMTPEILAVPLEAGAASVVVSGERALVRCSFGAGYAVGLSEAGAYLQLEQGLSCLTVFDPQQSWTPPADLEVKQMGVRSSVTGLLAAGLDRSPPLNLMQGEYHRQGERAERATRVWRWVALVAALAFGLEVSGRWLDYRSLENELGNLNQEAAQILNEAFPDVGRVVNPRVQMDQRLASLRQSSGIGGNGFLYLLRATGPTLVAAKDLEIRSASYRGGDLILEVHANSLAAIEALRQRIMDTGSVQIALESATTLESGADAKLRIGGAAP